MNPSDTRGRDRPGEPEITKEMIDAGREELLLFDPDERSPGDAEIVSAIFRAMYKVSALRRKSNC